MHSDPEVEVWFGNCQDEDGFRHWYQVWSKPQSIGNGKGKDLLFSHGTGVHSGTFAVSISLRGIRVREGVASGNGLVDEL